MCLVEQHAKHCSELFAVMCTFLVLRVFCTVAKAVQCPARLHFLFHTLCACTITIRDREHCSLLQLHVQMLNKHERNFFWLHIDQNLFDVHSAVLFLIWLWSCLEAGPVWRTPLILHLGRFSCCTRSTQEWELASAVLYHTELLGVLLVILHSHMVGNVGDILHCIIDSNMAELIFVFVVNRWD